MRMNEGRRAAFYNIKYFMWLVAFLASSWFLTNLENTFNKRGVDLSKALFVGTSAGGLVQRNLNVFSLYELPFLALIFFCAFMFAKEITSLSNYLRSLNTNGDKLLAGVNE